MIWTLIVGVTHPHGTTSPIFLYKNWPKHVSELPPVPTGPISSRFSLSCIHLISCAMILHQSRCPLISWQPMTHLFGMRRSCNMWLQSLPPLHCMSHTQTADDLNLSLNWLLRHRECLPPWKTFVLPRSQSGDSPKLFKTLVSCYTSQSIIR